MPVVGEATRELVRLINDQEFNSTPGVNTIKRQRVDGKFNGRSDPPATYDDSGNELRHPVLLVTGLPRDDKVPLLHHCSYCPPYPDSEVAASYGDSEKPNTATQETNVIVEASIELGTPTNLNPSGETNHHGGDEGNNGDHALEHTKAGDIQHSIEELRTIPPGDGTSVGVKLQLGDTTVDNVQPHTSHPVYTVLFSVSMAVTGYLQVETNLVTGAVFAGVSFNIHEIPIQAGLYVGPASTQWKVLIGNFEETGTIGSLDLANAFETHFELGPGWRMFTYLAYLRMYHSISGVPLEMFVGEP